MEQLIEIITEETKAMAEALIFVGASPEDVTLSVWHLAEDLAEQVGLTLEEIF